LTLKVRIGELWDHDQTLLWSVVQELLKCVLNTDSTNRSSTDLNYSKNH
jgi:hypothetical protein